ncbi:MAG: hypothetical protein ACK6A9_20885 [Dolichospermum sp.]|jgi:hypothetical protein|uniref:hypothetical protein n=1 Tax=Dolichospermum TaxID=748770 RepID=UPI00048348F2|nr:MULTISPECIES: hypothetical protein [Dolichospermum]MBD1213729.1 hypothetical protein [Dolichospermum circinale Clear-D4]MBD2445140.1 hypothetical protein [Dolichospermum sp. FACHB-1091]MDB9453891.1 hypothetical protein [Dolichospermum circinale CS-541/06]MDB9464796.1 hypothetical protein [Dolichospermum circinale CS-541/04]MDB9474280.1 hypothetical protein [Dolichospermum circinale CS-537/11]
MGVFNKVTATFQESRQFIRRSLEEYIMFIPEAKQLILNKKMVLLLCQQAESRVEQLKSLEPHSEEGLIATIEYKKIQIQLHFTPEKITLHENCLEGELRLLKSPQFETESIVYRYLIAGWVKFLGGKLPNGALPKEVRIENNKVYYTLPRNELQLLDSLFHNLENDSALMTTLKQGDLTIETSVVLSWNNFKLKNLLQLLNFKAP